MQTQSRATILQPPHSGRRPTECRLPLSIAAVQDRAQVAPDWTPVGVADIEGVTVKPITNVITNSGRLTEIWRADWALDTQGVEQVFQRTLDPGAVTAWHVHLETTDRLFCGIGEILLVLFDARTNSPTHRALAEYRLGEHRPLLVSVPPGVFHGVKALGSQPSVLINAVDRAYGYDMPDHHRVPANSPEIPFRF